MALVPLFLLLLAVKGILASASGPPKIIEHPEDTAVAKNEPVTLGCKAEGEPSPTITWFKDGQPVITAATDRNSHRVLFPSGSLFFLRAVHTRKEFDGGIYWCQASNDFGTVASKNATLTIAVLRDKFRLEPENTGVVKGGIARLICAAPKGTPSPTIFWKKNGKLLDTDKDPRVSMEVEGSLVITNVDEEDDAKYQCMAKNEVGTRASAKAQLSVLVKPYVIKAPENVSAVAGDEIDLPCVVGGRPKPELQWIRQNGDIPPNRAMVKDNSVLNLRNVSPEDQDIYVCRADNPAGSVEVKAAVLVHSPPIFLVEPSDQKVAEGAPAALDCIAAGNPTPTLFWIKESNPGIILPATSHGHVTVTPEGTLRISSVSPHRDAGWYSCAAVSESGSVLARAEVNVAKEADRPPPIIQLGPVNQTLPVQTSATLPCQASGSHEVISWLKDGVPLSTLTDPRFQVDSDNTLTIKDLTLSDSGLYTCQAKSKSGQAVWSSSLLVADPVLDPTVTFNSMPYLSQFPASPSKPQLVNATDNSITLSWDKPHRIGGSALQGYQLDYYTLESPTHWITIGDVSEEVFTVRNLAPLSTAIFVVRAQNQHGLSPPSPMSKPMMTTEDLKQPSSSQKPDIKAVRLKLSQRILELKEALVVGSRKVKLLWEVISGQGYVTGFHIQVRDMSVSDNLYDVVTISGGGTRSHTLSDLRPATTYTIFILPYNQKVIGTPSNLKVVTTKEDVPASPPGEVTIQLFNATSALIMWGPPNARDLNGDLQGYKVIIGNQNASLLWSNFTLDSEVTSLQLDNLTSEEVYWVKVAAYNRQGMGPFSKAVELKVDPGLWFEHQLPPVHQEFPGDMVIQEIWFVTLVAVLAVLVIVAFVATVCIQRKKAHLKDLGHYNVPVHKVDDITHVNFSDRDHLWFDPNWKSSGGSSGTSSSLRNNNNPNHDSGEDDPMAAMLDRTAKNTNANIFVNKLHGLVASEYAEVNHVLENRRPTTHQQQQGPYATTNLIDPSNTSSSSLAGNGGNGKLSSLCHSGSNKSNKSLSSKSDPSDNNKENSHNASNGLHHHNDKGSSPSLGSGASNNSCLQAPPPLPPPPAPEVLHHFPSPFQTRHFNNNGRLLHGNAISDARLYNRSLMGGAGNGEQQQTAPPPAPPTRGLSSYNGVRTGSFASFGHPTGHYGPPMQLNGFSHSQYSVPGMFFHHMHPCCPSPFDHHMSQFSNGYLAGTAEDHYESASICYGSPASNKGGGHRGPKARNYPRGSGTLDKGEDHATEFCDEDQEGWEWEDLSDDNEKGCDENGDFDEESFYAAEDQEFNETTKDTPKQVPKVLRSNGNIHHPPGGRLAPYPDDFMQGSPNKGRKLSRPTSQCSTDSNFSSISGVIYQQQQRRLKRPPKNNGHQKLPKRGPNKHHLPKIYSTFKPPNEQEQNNDKVSKEANEEVTTQACEKSQNDKKTEGENSSNVVVELSTQVSQDMSELVYHLNSIQNDISELAGRPISLTKIED